MAFYTINEISVGADLSAFRALSHYPFYVLNFIIPANVYYAGGSVG